MYIAMWYAVWIVWPEPQTSFNLLESDRIPWYIAYDWYVLFLNSALSPWVCQGHYIFKARVAKCDGWGPQDPLDALDLAFKICQYFSSRTWMCDDWFLLNWWLVQHVHSLAETNLCYWQAIFVSRQGFSSENLGEIVQDLAASQLAPISSSCLVHKIGWEDVGQDCSKRCAPSLPSTHHFNHDF